MDDREMPISELIELAKTDNGACAKLCAELRIDTYWYERFVSVLECESGDFLEGKELFSDHKDERLVAWRAAVVALAAAIGKEGK